MMDEVHAPSDSECYTPSSGSTSKLLIYFLLFNYSGLYLFSDLPCSQYMVIIEPKTNTDVKVYYILVCNAM
jgi:hypothetical protein